MAQDEACMRFGKVVRSLRLDRGLSQEALARTMEMSRETVRVMEAGKFWPRIPTLFKMADAFGIDAGELLRGRDSNPEPIDYQSNAFDEAA